MNDLGHEIRTIRNQSPYRDLRSFSKQAGLSHEGLRKIEHGERIPNRDTLDKILEIGKVPKKKADELRTGRDQAQATRDGLSLPLYSTDEKLRQISHRVMVTIKRFLAECNLELPQKEEKALHTRMETILRKEIRG